METIENTATAFDGSGDVVDASQEQALAELFEDFVRGEDDYEPDFESMHEARMEARYPDPGTDVW